MSGQQSPDDSYVVRYGPNRSAALGAFIFLLGMGAGVAFLLRPDFFRGGGGPLTIVGGGSLVLTAGYGLVVAVRALRRAGRRVALRVDGRGMTFGDSREPREEFVPWADILAVVVWSKPVGLSPWVYLGVVRRPGAPPLALLAQRQVTGVELAIAGQQLMADSQQVHLYRLDTPKLADAVARFAPGVAFATDRLTRAGWYG